MSLIIQSVRDFTAALEPWWTVVLVPIWQEVVFRYLPFRFWYLSGGNFWLVGIASNIAFAAIHRHLGWLFMLWALVAGMFQWWVMVEYGLVAAVLVHAFINIVDMTFGLRRFLISV